VTQIAAIPAFCSRRERLSLFQEVHAMSEASVLRQKAEMFEMRAESAADPVSRQHYREMAAHYRQLLVEHLDVHSQEFAE
jgi:hypothetical protein